MATLIGGTVQIAGFKFADSVPPLFALGLFALYAFVIVYPYWRIVGRLGYGLGMSIVWLIGFAIVPFIVVWFFAFANWPAFRDGRGSKQPG
jgi:hypothetical protein